MTRARDIAGGTIFTSADHTKLDGIATGATAYVHPTGAGNQHVPAAGAAGQVLQYASAGTATWADAVGGGTGFISSVDIDDVTYVDFDLSGDASSYDNYVFFMQNVKPVTDGQNLHLQTSSNGGSNFDAGGTDYVQNAYGGNAGSAGYIQVRTTVGNADTDGGLSGLVYMYGPHLSQRTIFNIFNAGFNNVNNMNMELRFGARVSQAAVNGVRFKTSSGNYKSGTITCYGFKNS